MPEALKKRPAQKLTINFLKGDSTNLALKIVKIVTEFGLPIVVVVSLAIFGAAFWKFILDQQLTELNNEVSAAAMTIESNAGIERELTAANNKYADVIADANNDQIALLLPKLIVVIPTGVRVIEMTVDQEKVSFVGYANSRDAITTLVKNIELIKNEAFADGQKAEFSDLKISEISSSSSTKNDFNFSLSFSYKIGKESNSSK